MIPNHHLNQCWLIFSATHRRKVYYKMIYIFFFSKWLTNPGSNELMKPILAGLVGSLIPPSSQSVPSPAGSPTKGQSHSAHTSPTNTAKLRPRASSAESDSKKLVRFFCLFEKKKWLELLSQCWCDIRLRGLTSQWRLKLPWDFVYHIYWWFSTRLQ